MAIRLAATDTHLEYSGNVFLNSTSSHTIEFWVNLPTWASVISLVGLYGTGASPTASIQIGTRGLGVLDAWTWGGTNIISSPTTMVANTPYHIAFTTSNDFWRLYINGAAAKVDLFSGAQVDYDRIFINGFPTSTVSETSTALIENLSIYNRSLLPRELQTIANCRGNRHGIIDGLIAKYDFTSGVEGADVGNIPDLSGNGRSLTISGASASRIKYTYADANNTANLRRVM